MSFRMSRDPTSDKRSLSLQLTSGKRLRMSLQRRSVDISGARFREITEKGEREITLERRDCFFSGPVEEDGGGFASLAMCGGELVGSITTPTRDYDIHTLRQRHDKREDDDVMRAMVTWQDNQHEKRDLNDVLTTPYVTDASSGAYNIADKKATIEIGDFLDRFFIADLKKKLDITTNEKIIELIIAKWTGAAHTLSDKGKVGWDLTLRLVDVVIMRTDPSWYQVAPQEKLGIRMKKICAGTKTTSYDQITLHTGDTSDPIRIGLAWLGGLCLRGFRCSANRASNTNFRTELHELGHSMGLNHEGAMEECRSEEDQTIKGFMAGNREVVRPCYKTVLARTLS
ncbi:hypothetical protein ACOMHN_028913 [Nucella lapillus]